jgi:hypothetical protein
VLISEKELLQIAKEVGCAPKAIERLLGSLKVSLQAPAPPFDDSAAGEQPSKPPLDIGLRVPKLERKLSPSEQRQIAATLKEYRSQCPVVFGWICSGDFNVKKPPERLGPGEGLHACRTAGRLRAALLRQGLFS